MILERSLTIMMMIMMAISGNDIDLAVLANGSCCGGSGALRTGNRRRSRYISLWPISRRSQKKGSVFREQRNMYRPLSGVMLPVLSNRRRFGRWSRYASTTSS